jgi:cobalt/nickel transport protein
MTSKNKSLLIGGLIIALILGVLSPFIASTNPDGLDASAEHLNPAIMDNPGYWHAPFDNYQVKLLGDGPLAGIAALVIGVLIALGFVYVVTEILKRRSKIDN